MFNRLRPFNALRGIQALRTQGLSARGFGQWIPDGKERNDYQHKEFTPFHYNGHCEQWDNEKWPLNVKGLEQSPIALFRQGNPQNGHVALDFQDMSYEHKYNPNKQ